MKRSVMLVVAALLAGGCEYEAPLSAEHTVPIDAAVLGVWEAIPDADQDTEPTDRMVILKVSDTEYLVHYPAQKNGIYYRAYPLNLGGTACVQLQIIGTAGGPPGPGEKKLFHVASYQLDKDVLAIRMLNTRWVDAVLKESEALKAAFLENKDTRDLFDTPGRFRRVTDRSTPEPAVE